MCVCVCVCCSCSVVSDSLRPDGLWLIRLLCPWSSSPAEKTGVACHSLLQRSFPTQRLWRDCLLHCEQILYCLSHWESFIQPMCYVKTTSLSVLVLGSSFSPAVRYLYCLLCLSLFFCCYFFLTFKIGFLPAKKIVLLLLYPQEQQVTLQM